MIGLDYSSMIQMTPETLYTNMQNTFKLMNDKDAFNLVKNNYKIMLSDIFDKKERKENIKGAFKIKNIEKIMNNKILIIDDIYTTGSTLNECSNLLRKNGIKKENIGVLTLAKD